MRFIYKLLVTTLIFSVVALFSKAQNNSVSIGTTTTHPSAVLWLESSSGDQGFVLPVGSRTSVANPAKGMLIFDSNQVYFHDGTTWNPISGGASSGKVYSLSVNSANQLVLSDGTTSVPTTVPIAGDVTGTSLGNTTVSRILGKQIGISSFPSVGTQNLVYDGASGTWKLQAGTSTTTPTLSGGQILTGDGTTNSATTLTGDASLTGGALKITGLQGSALPALSAASSTINLLSYNATTSKWEFKDPTGANLMLKAVYDPTNKAADVFDLTKHAGVLSIANGGTGLSQTPTSNQVLVGNSSNGYSLSTLTAGTGISITNTSGTLTISSSGGSGSLSLTTLGNSGAATLVGSILNVPTYTLAGLGGISLTSLSSTSPLVYNNLTGAFSITPATNATDGYLTKADWTTFNNKQGAITLTTTGTSGAATLVGSTLNIPQYTSSAYTAGTGLTLTSNTFSVNTSQNITTLSNLTSKGIVTTSATGVLGSTQGTGFLKDSGTGSISYDNSTYLTGNQSITLSGDISGTGATAITTAIGAGKVTNTMLAGSIAASKLIGTDINTVGTITSGTWNGTKISETFGGTNQATYTTGDVLYASAANTLSKLGVGANGQVLTVSGGVPSWQTVTGTGTVTNVTGNLPITVATGTTTPVINIAQANGTTNGYLLSTDWATFNSKQGAISLTTTGSSGAATFASNTLNIPTYTLTGLGGISLTSLSATAPLSYNSVTGGFSIANAAADGTTKGAASFATNDFDATTGNISLDYTNGQAATSTTKGFLTSGDWTTFNSKQGAITLTTTGTSGAATLVGNTLNIPQYSATAYTAGAGLTLASNTFSVNTSQNISALTNLITKGLVTTTSLGVLGSTQGTGFLKDNGTGTISYDNSTYLTSFTESDPTVKAINGIVKSNGTTISAAVAGTDYAPPVPGSTILKGNGTGGFASAVSGTDYAPATSGTSLLKGNGTGGFANAVAGTDYLNANQTITLSGDVTGTGTTALTTSIGAGKVTNTMLAGSIAANKLVGTDINTVGTITTGVWNGTRITEAFGGTNQTTYATGDILYASASNTLSKLTVGTAGQVLTVSSGIPAWATNSIANLTINTTTGTISEGLSTSLSGTNNTLMGHQSGSANTGNGNTFIGRASGTANTSGSQNTFLGVNAGSLNTSASGNVFVGDSAGNGVASGVGNATGSSLVLVGQKADVSADGLTNAVAIGSSAIVTASNTIQLGNAAVTTVNLGTGTTTRLVTGGLQVTGGTIAAGNVLTSDASGNAVWQAAGAGSGWSLTGNGTVTAANFLGSTNDIPLTFKVNNLKAGYIDNTTGATFNTYLGLQAGNITTGIANSFFGYQAGKANTTGGNNAAFGKFAMTNNTTGSDNTAIGYNAMINNTTAGSNTAIGRSALFTMSSSAAGNTNNTAVGYQALYNTNPTSASDGKMNTSIGYNSGLTNSTGNYNTFLGTSADASSGTLTNASAIGAQAYVGASNSLVLGSISGVNGASSNTNVGIGTTTPSASLEVVGGSTLIRGANSNTAPTPGSALELHIGRSNAGGLISGQSSADIALDWGGAGGGYKHFIQSRHNAVASSTSNAIDFWINNSTSQTGSVAPNNSTGNGNVLGMSITAAGVGIATSSPAYQLDVNGTANVSTFNVATVTSGALASSAVFNGGVLFQKQLILNSIPNVTGSVVSTFDNVYDLGSSSNRWRNVYAGNSVIQTSDIRLKENVKSLNYGLNEVMNLRPVSYNWKKDSTGKVNLGLIAQEVLKVVPEAVNVPKDGSYLGMNYSNLIPVLIKSIQEQQKLIDDQKKQIEDLKAVQGQKETSAQLELNQLKNEIANIKKALGLEVSTKKK